MRRRDLLFCLIAAAALVTDYVTKAWVKNTFFLGECRQILPFFNLTYIENRGIAFGMFNEGSPYKQYVLVAVTFAAVGVIVTMYIREGRASARMTSALAAILGGALGNLHDRMFRGSVVDFLDFHAGGHHWPVFNAADVFITVGVAVLLLIEFGAARHRNL